MKPVKIGYKLYRRQILMTVVAAFSLAMFTRCGDFGLFNQISSPVTVVVFNANKINYNKTSPSAAVSLWAASTRHEDPRYSFEKVKLEKKRDGVYSGIVPLADQGGTAIIIFDDAVQGYHPYGPAVSDGVYFYPDLLKLSGYFSPCQGAMTTSFVPLWAKVANNRVPHLTTGEKPLLSASATNDEVYMVRFPDNNSNSNGKSLMEVDYTTMKKAPYLWFCNCTRSVTYFSTLSNTWMQTAAIASFTDDNHFTPNANPYNTVYFSPSAPPPGSITGATGCPIR